MGTINGLSQNPEAWFAEIMKSSDEYSTEKIKDWNLLKSDILNILKTHRPIKISDYELGISANLKENGRLIIHEFKNRNFVREYSTHAKRGNLCCGCFSNRFIEKYGIIFVKNQHICKLRQYSAVMENQEKLKQKMLNHGFVNEATVANENLNTKIVLHEQHEYDKNEESVFEKIIQSSDEYSTDIIQDWNLLKSDILNILKTHRPIKISDYELGISATLKENRRLIIHEFEDKNLVREYTRQSKYGSNCCECSSASSRFKYGILFAQNQHNCQARKYSAVMEKQEKLKQKFLQQSLVLQNEVILSNSKTNANSEKSVLLRQRRPIDKSEESLFDEILKSQKEFTERNIDLTSIKEEIIEILKTHRPLKTANYQIQMSNEHITNHCIFVFDSVDKLKGYEFLKNHKRNSEWRCYNFNKKLCSAAPLILKYGIAFIPLNHYCTLKKFNKLPTSSQKSFLPKMQNHNNDDNQIPVSENTAENVFNKIFNSLEEYTIQPKNVIKKEEILTILQTHQPVKSTHYQYGLSKNLEENIIIFENEQKTIVREYSKYADAWICDECKNRRKDDTSSQLFIIFEIVFVPKIHACNFKHWYVVQLIQQRLNEKKLKDSEAVKNNLSKSLNIDIVALPALEGPFSNDDQNSKFPDGSNNDEINCQPDITISSITNQSNELNTLQTASMSSILPETDFSDDHNESNVIDSTTENINDPTSVTDLTFQSDSIMESNVSGYCFTDNVNKNTKTTNSEILKRKINDNIENDDDAETHIFIDEKPPQPKKPKTENHPDIQETATPLNINKGTVPTVTRRLKFGIFHLGRFPCKEAEDDCVIIDEKPEICQRSMNEHFDSPFPFEGPSTSTLKNICQKLDVKYNKEAYKLWSKIEFEQISTVSANLKLHRFKTKNIFECFSLLFTGGTEQFYQIQNTINEAFRDKLIRSGKMSQREIDCIFMASTVSNEQLAFICKFLNCRIAIFKESCLSRFGKWSSESDILTLVLSNFNGFYSIVLNL